MNIRVYSPEDENVVIELWRKCNLIRPQNNPKLDIERKLKVNPELFLVGEISGKVVAIVIGGYEGHRGWINYLGVDPIYQKRGLGKQMMEAVEKKLLLLGCPKINLQVRVDNKAVIGFYGSIGYSVDNVISMGKRLIPD